MGRMPDVATSRVSPARLLRTRRSQHRASPRDPFLFLRYTVLMANTKLFQRVSDEVRRDYVVKARVSAAELEMITKAAQVRKLSVSEFMRRASLGRRADVDYVSDIVLALGASTKAIRDLHAGYLAKGIAPPEDVLLRVMNNASDVIMEIA